MKPIKTKNMARAAAAALLALAMLPVPARASSHMDAPLITLDPAANTADVYAFLQSVNGTKVLETALAVYPFEEPGIGPNKYNFDDNVLYEIHVATGTDVAAGQPDIYLPVSFHHDLQESEHDPAIVPRRDSKR